jgi:ATP-binding cassette subfamily B protein
MSKKTISIARQVAAYYWARVKRYPFSVSALLLLLPVVNLTGNVLPPLILATVLGRLSSGDFVVDQPWESFQSEIIMYSALILSTALITWRLVDFFVWRLEGRVQRDIARDVFNHLSNESADFHANNFSGSLVSQSNKLINSYIRVADTTYFSTIPLITSLSFTSIIMWPKSPQFVLLLLLFAATFIAIAFMASKPVRQKGAIHASAESKQTGYLADMIGNVMAVKSFAGESYERIRFEETTEHTRHKITDLMWASMKQMLFFSTISRTISSMALVMAVVSVVSFDADIATVFLIFSYTTSIVDQLFQFSNNSLRNYNRSIGDAGEMVKILNKETEIKDPSNPEVARMHRGAITLKNVKFTHKDADVPIFEDLNLRVKPGEKVGLVGHSGSGKTSFTRILLRFSDIDSGSIEIDGQNITHVRQADLRRAISYVPQEPILFHRTISENIAYGRPEADQKEIEAIARKSNADEFISKLPKGYQTVVGERGVKLSGGQRQRIVIARAMLKNAPILVLDEATSALDSESEGLIQDALWKLMEGRTAIVIAHRLSTIQRMDRIIVLDNGKIVEEGNHKHLLKVRGTYAKLWQHQSGGFLED